MALNLRVMGFCGADDSVAPEHLAVISHRFPWIEWGVLFRPDLEGTARYATWAWVERLSRAKSMMEGGADRLKLAGHLCASRCQQILDGDASFAMQLHGLGFGRIQINATAANKVQVDPAKLDMYASNIRSCMAAVPEIEFIFQLNDETRGIWSCIQAQVPAEPIPQNMSILYDASCGLGVLASEYPAPLDGLPCGYAGGIGPSNLGQVLLAVERASNGLPVWIDMESSLRVNVTDKQSPAPNDVFSLDKCFACAIEGAHIFQRA